jgi:hypothetical protein
MEVNYEYLKDLDVIKVSHKVLFNGLKENDLMSSMIENLSRRFNCTRFLMDADEMKLDQSFIDSYYLGEYFHELGFKKEYRIAFLYTRDEDLYLFLELVLQNRGFSTRFFLKKRQKPSNGCKRVGRNTINYLRASTQSHLALMFFPDRGVFFLH